MKDLLSGPSLEASLDDLKAVYRVLCAHAEEHPELSDNAFVESLHDLLEAQAKNEGIDVDDDECWNAWLNGQEQPSEDRSGDLLN